MIVISNTEVSTFNLCERQHYYRFVLNLEPRFFSADTPIGLCIIGHEALEGYYRTLMDGGSLDDAVAISDEVLDKKLMEIADERPEEFQELVRVAHLKQLIEAYRHHYGAEPFRVVAVEQELHTPISDNLEYGMKLDIIIEWTSGVNRGDLEVWDHKFVYNFKSPAELEMDCQLPKYKHTAKANGYYITRSRFNQLRYREMKAPSMDQLFKRSRQDTTADEVKQIWHEQEETASRIAEKRLPVRTQHILTCRGCFFQRLCKADQMGLNTEKMKVTDYKPAEKRYVDFIDQGSVFSG